MRLYRGKDFGDQDDVQIYPPCKDGAYWAIRIEHQGGEADLIETDYPVLIRWHNRTIQEIMIGEDI